jgi:hypothetical protein
MFDLLIYVRVDLARRFIELFADSCGLIHKSAVLFQRSVGFFLPQALHPPAPRRYGILSNLRQGPLVRSRRGNPESELCT